MTPNEPTVPTGSFRLPVEGTEVAYTIRGSGPVCLAHPGGPGFDSSYLRSPELEQRFTVVYVDPLGTGPSGKLPAGEHSDRDYSRARDVRVLEAIRAKLGIPKVCLIGHSYGGFVVLEYAIAHPDHVAGLLLYSTGPATDAAWAADVTRRAESLFARQPWYADAIAAFAEKTTDEAAVDAALRRMLPLYFADWEGHKSAYAFVQSMRPSYEVMTRRPQGKLYEYDVRRRLGVVHTTPTIVIAGERDFLFGPEVGKQLAGEIAGADLVVIPGAGHFAHIEQPEAFAAAVAKFADKLE